MLNPKIVSRENFENEWTKVNIARPLKPYNEYGDRREKMKLKIKKEEKRKVIKDSIKGFENQRRFSPLNLK